MIRGINNLLPVNQTESFRMVDFGVVIILILGMNFNCGSVGGGRFREYWVELYISYINKLSLPQKKRKKKKKTYIAPLPLGHIPLRL